VVKTNLKTVGKALGGFLFPFIFSLFIIIFSFAQMDAEFLKDLSADALRSQIPEGTKESLVVESFKLQCIGKDKISLELSGKVIIDCGELRSAGSLDELVDILFDTVYQRRYPCSFPNCIQYMPEVLLTLQGKSLMQTYSLITLVISMIFAAILVLSLNGFGKEKGLGIALISVGILYIPLKYFPMDPELAGITSQITELFANNFLLALIIGIILLVIGYGGEFFYKKNKRETIVQNLNRKRQKFKMVKK
jgi:hypothetical protein